MTNSHAAKIDVLAYVGEMTTFDHRASFNGDDAAYQRSVMLRAETALNEIKRLRAQVKDMAQEIRDTARGAADEARWQERQGEEYGSY